MYFPTLSGIHNLTAEDVMYDRVDGDQEERWARYPYRRWNTFRRALKFLAPLGFELRTYQVAFLTTTPRYVFLASSGMDEECPYLIVRAEETQLEILTIRDAEILLTKTYDYDTVPLTHKGLFEIADVFSDLDWGE